MIKSENLEIIPNYVSGLIGALDNKSRKRLAYKLAILMRRSNASRISRQTEPSGRKFTPRSIYTRKAKRRKKMFAKIKQQKYLKTKATSNYAQVYFGFSVAQIAKTHHFGFSERAGKIRKNIIYPKRELLGFNNQDLNLIDQAIIQHLFNIKAF